jgi:hypothetical protein
LEQAPPAARDLPIIVRPDVLSADPEPFIANVVDHLRPAATLSAPQRTHEPRRLFDAKEYRAAVISAVTLLEEHLRGLLGNQADDRRRNSMRFLLDRAKQRGLIKEDDLPRIDRWIRLRNIAVHSSEHVGRADAKEVVDGVLRLVTRQDL